MQSSSNSKEYSDSLGKMQSYLRSNSSKDHFTQNQDFYDSLKNDFVKSQNASKSYQEAQQVLEQLRLFVNMRDTEQAEVCRKMEPDDLNSAE